jgi:sortase A
MHRRLTLTIERLCLVIGLALLVIYGGVRLYQRVASRAAVESFEAARAAGTSSPIRGGARALEDPSASGTVDVSLWSPKRIASFRQALAASGDPPMAVLRIPKLQLAVAVFDGTNDFDLNRGAGWIAGTALPGQAGNTGIAAHRDGFFRGLKDIHNGDTISLRTPNRDLTYEVDGIEIVMPNDVGVLAPRSGPSLTLITCYPFYFVGDAPQRYVVHASLVKPGL